MAKNKKQNSFPCDCGRKLLRLTTKDAGGNTGTISVNYNGLSMDELRSIRMGIPVPFIEAEHKKIAHILTCDKQLVSCRTCGQKIVFYETKPNLEKNGHNRPGKMPMDWHRITKEERFRIIQGLPVKYNILEHRDFNHHANKDCK